MLLWEVLAVEIEQMLMILYVLLLLIRWIFYYAQVCDLLLHSIFYEIFCRAMY